MRRLFLFCIIMCFSCNWVICINEYDYIEIGMIENGIKTGQCMYKKGFMSGDLPMEFAISNDNKIYVCDAANDRINVYDMNLNFIREIPDKGNSKLSHWYKIEIDNSGNIIIMGLSNKGFVKYDNNGNLKFGDRNLNYENGMENVFIIENSILFFNDDWEPQIVDNDGNLLNTLQKEEYLTYLEDKYKGEIKNNIGLEQKLNDYLTNNRIFLLRDRLLLREFYEVKSFYNFLGGNIREIELKDRINFNIESASCFRLLNFDKYDNSYWYCGESSMVAARQIVIVLSKYGEILDCIYNKKLEYTKPKVSNDGDIYIMEATKNGHYFYKIKRVWGLDQVEHSSTMDSEEEKKQSKEDKPVVSRFLYSNYITYDKDYYMYHPIKAFDGKAETGWLENSNGPGIDDFIGLEFESEVMIDTIKIMPGYFDKKWWKQNNRVKNLLIVTPDFEYMAVFKDERKAQEIKFNEPIITENIRFIVKDIFKTIKWDDTGISEIEFYYKGKKIELDLSKQNNYLQKVTEKEVKGDK